MDRARQVLLVNFLPKDAERLERVGLSADIGYVGTAVSQPGAPVALISVPHPPYEYDIYVYNSDCEALDSPLKPKAKYLALQGGALDGLCDYQRFPRVRVSFLGPRTALKENVVGGAPTVHTELAHENVSSFQICSEDVFGIPAVSEFISKLGNRIERVWQYVRPPQDYPIHHIPVLANRNGDIVASYGTAYTGERNVLLYVVLPQFRDNTAVLLDLLRTIAQVEPGLLPQLACKQWMGSAKYAFSEEMVIEREIAAKRKEFESYSQAKREEALDVAKKFGFIRAILTATETGAEDGRLSANVKRVLEFVGFKVTDIDSELKKAIKKEDFWVQDEGFFAIAEVSATSNKNPKTKEYSDLLGRRSTIFQRRDLVPDVDRSLVSGLLVLNFDIDTEPDRRPLVYTGGEEEFVRAAVENSIGLLSTVDLYRIAVAVKDHRLGREEARAVIKKFGRIRYPAPEEATSTTASSNPK